MERPSPRARGLFVALGILIVILLALALRAVVHRADVYAYVDGEPIRKPIVDFEREMILHGSTRERPTPELERAALNAAVDRAIERYLVAREARHRGMTASRERQAAYRRDVLERVTAWTSPDTLMKILRVTEEEFAATIEDDVLWSMMNDEIVKTIAPPKEAELERLYNENIEQFREDEAVRLLDIFFAKGDSPDTQARVRERAEEARTRALLGEDFQGLAAAYSDGSGKLRGGDMGWVKKGMLPPPMEKAVAAMKDADVSDVLETRDGLHVVKVIGHRSAGYAPFPEVRERIATRLVLQEQNRRFSQLTHSLRAAARIVRYD